jgi:rare lipoprotein A
MRYSCFVLPLLGMCAALSQAPTLKLPDGAKPTAVAGKATWYGGEFHGRPTASGEVFNMHRFTAASRDLPLGSLVLVTNLSNRRSVVVRVNDRGPYSEPDRIIDLSYAASRRLGMVEEGVTEVHVQAIPNL